MGNPVYIYLDMPEYMGLSCGNVFYFGDFNLHVFSQILQGQSILKNILHLNTVFFLNKCKFLYKELKNVNKTLLCKYANCRKFRLRKKC